MSATATLLERAKAASRDGQLEFAHQLVQQAQATLVPETPMRQRFEVVLATARILRQLGDPQHLAQALGMARQAQRLARFLNDATQSPRVQLELAACQIMVGGGYNRQELSTLTQHPEPHYAGRAWQLLGEAALAENRVFTAIADLLNAVAEHRRTHDKEQTFSTHTSLLLAFSRAGHEEDADRLAAEGQKQCQRVGRRECIEFLLADAEHARQAGRIQQALDTLATVERQLGGTSGLDGAWYRLHQLQADCLADWHQTAEAVKHRNKASGFLYSPPPRPVAGPQPVNCAVSTRWLNDAHPRQPHATTIELRIRDLGRIANPKPEHARTISRELAALHGKPGLERTEAILLYQAGVALTGFPDCELLAERLLRRALVRLEFLEGTEIWWAQCQVALGTLLGGRPDSQSREEALELLTLGLQGLDAQRFQMIKRSYRVTWLTSLEHKAFDKAIELAVASNRSALAADLITFSRLAGVPSPTTDQPLVADELPLVPVPTLGYIDGTTSKLGSSQHCHLI